ncbi:hypothetical protein V6N11_016620 [Hibiscus sabdariffa]|uniref:Integrase, catalytic region, zinc finger, CCHC-type, peptidase aspartic, catalytic n=1 Tax=Hibiscus sabdariffa TaxID=183260 RepID=A0ABR2TVJ3_9ROSI
MDSTGRVYTSRHVKFDEGCFPYVDKASRQQHNSTVVQSIPFSLDSNLLSTEEVPVVPSVQAEVPIMDTSPQPASVSFPSTPVDDIASHPEIPSQSNDHQTLPTTTS